jgi:serine/threonine protein kinase
LFWAIQIISAFGYLHEKKIVHRDVKMANILIDEHSNLKVCDFGLAHQFKSDDEELDKCCGTPTTWAPEVIKS